MFLYKYINTLMLCKFLEIYERQSREIFVDRNLDIVTLGAEHRNI
jgi:hypothetical protein